MYLEQVFHCNCFYSFYSNFIQNFSSTIGYMSQRKEAIFAMLATTSIGAIWGGPLPYYGGRVRFLCFMMMYTVMKG